MKVIKRRLIYIALFQLIAGLNGCASNMIDVRKGSEKISQVDVNQVDSCLSKGTTVASVLAEFGFISRSDEAVEANLLQLARNSALDVGGDTVVKGKSTQYGKRTFAIYKCRP